MVSTPLLWASLTRLLTYSMVMPGTVPGAGNRTISAPAPINSSTSRAVIICSPASDGIPDACILPAARITLSPTAAFSRRKVSVMAPLETPLPGFPVSRIMSTPISQAFTAFSTVARRPGDIFHILSGSSPPALSSTGSRLMPTMRPVNRFSSRTQSSGFTFGRP